MKARSQSSSIPIKPSSGRRRKGVAKTRWTKVGVLRELRGLADPRVREQMAYFGVNVPKAHGISAPVLHAVARRIGKDEKEVRRILDPTHPTKLPALTAALRALGKRLVVGVTEAEAA